MGEVQIREAEPGDAAGIRPLVRELGYEPKGLTDILQRVQRSPKHSVLIAIQDGIPLGWLEVRWSLSLAGGESAEILGLVVAEQARSKGIGRNLVEAAIARAEEWGIKDLRVRTRLERSGAHAFYEKLGFKLAKSQRVYDLLIE